MTTELWSVVIAGLALVVSLGSAVVQEGRYRMRQTRADVSVRLQWLPALSEVRTHGGEDHRAGYNLVLENGGPSAAQDLLLEVSAMFESGECRSLCLLDLHSDELPLAELPAGSRYPIRFIDADRLDRNRRFSATVSWRDASGSHERVIPLRRGYVGSQ